MHIAHAVEVRPVSTRLHSSPERGTCTVILASGPEDAGRRATLAFSAAFTAQSMDLDTLVFLVGDGAYWGYEGRAAGVHATGFPALGDLIEGFQEAGGRIVLCSACDAVCAADVDAEGVPLRRLAGVRPQGLASVISHSAKGNSLTF
jgi:predicted peroxiredoxin